MSFNRASRRNFLRAAGIPIAGGLSGLPILASPQPLSLNGGGGVPPNGNESLPVEVENGASPSIRVKEAVLFPFDDHSIPFTWGLRLRLIMGKTFGRKNPIVLRRGGPGDPDNLAVQYYGTVIQVGDELRMWYMGGGDKLKLKAGSRVPLYAVSKDGINWEKPKLGLVEYNGSKQNNIVDLMGGEYGIAESVVIHEPEDSNPSRRFKMAFESAKYDNRLAVAFSPDGLRWTESIRNPVATALEESGLIKYNGCYYVNGQGVGWQNLNGQYGSGRKMVTFASYDFEHWTATTALSFQRGPVVVVDDDKINSLEEVHIGASLIDRGNVILGLYGMWHGNTNSDRGHVGMDLGLIVSNDAMHFREPVQDFHFLPAFEEAEVPPSATPALAQGQGMINKGDKTLYWYESWATDTSDVRLATWERDRMGYYRTFPNPATNPYSHSLSANLVSCPMTLAREGGRVFINASGLSDNSNLTVEIQDREFRPLPGYTAQECVPLQNSGLRQAVIWKSKEKLEAFPHAIRVRVVFGGIRPEDIKLYAIYVSGA